MPAPWLRRFLAAERGASAAEFALVALVFLALILTTINLSLALYSANSLHFAAQKTARCFAMASLNGEIGDNDCLEQAPSFYKGAQIAATFAHSTASCGNTVTGTGTFQLVTGVANLALPLSASACYPLQ